MIHIFAIHGINNDARERLTFGARWESILRAHGFDVEVTPCPWRSSGSVAGDLARLNSPARGRIYNECLDVFAEWIEYLPHNDDPVVVLGHSFGAVIAPDLIKRSAFRGGGLVTIGSPLFHPLYGLPINKRPPLTTTNVAFYNRRDPVCAMFGLVRDLSEGWNPLEVSFGADGDAVRDQHAAEAYLEHPNFVDVFAQITGEPFN